MGEYEAQPLPAVAAPLDIEIVDDEVVFIGPGAVAFAMTMSAALETANRLDALLGRRRAGPGGPEQSGVRPTN